MLGVTTGVALMVDVEVTLEVVAVGVVEGAAVMSITLEEVVPAGASSVGGDGAKVPSVQKLTDLCGWSVETGAVGGGSD